ncbi:MAG: regulatory protein RecX [Lachnospiraceae bacterium]
MIITSIEPWKKNKFKIYIDGQFAFFLTKEELSRYCLQEEHTISKELRDELEQLVSKRAIMRAMQLLEIMNRTEAEMRIKLKKSFYPDIAIEAAVAYVKSYRYINDGDYARNYIQGRLGSKSKREIYEKLVIKGIAKSVIEDAMEEYDQESEQEAIRSILKKRHFHAESATVEEKRKLYGYLARKGFHYEDIRQVLQVSESF